MGVEAICSHVFLIEWLLIMMSLVSERWDHVVLIAEESSLCSLSGAETLSTQRLLAKAWRRLYRFRRN